MESHKILMKSHKIPKSPLKPGFGLHRVQLVASNLGSTMEKPHNFHLVDKIRKNPDEIPWNLKKSQKNPLKPGF